MAPKTNYVFIGLHIISWLIFVGLSIEAGGLLVNFFFSLYNPEIVGRLYQKLDLSNLYNQNRGAFFGTYSFILSIALLKVFLFYIVIRLLSRIDLSKPFNHYVSNQISQLGYYTFSIGLISVIARQWSKNMLHHGYATGQIDQFWADGQAFILMAAVVYVIGAIFRKGVEIQMENELTV